MLKRAREFFAHRPVSTILGGMLLTAIGQGLLIQKGAEPTTAVVAINTALLLAQGAAHQMAAGETKDAFFARAANLYKFMSCLSAASPLLNTVQGGVEAVAAATGKLAGLGATVGASLGMKRVTSMVHSQAFRNFVYGAVPLAAGVVTGVLLINLTKQTHAVGISSMKFGACQLVTAAGCAVQSWAHAVQAHRHGHRLSRNMAVMLSTLAVGNAAAIAAHGQI